MGGFVCKVGFSVGFSVGLSVGVPIGILVGAFVGASVGAEDGFSVSFNVGPVVGLATGAFVGDAVGWFVFGGGLIACEQMQEPSSEYNSTGQAKQDPPGTGLYVPAAHFKQMPLVGYVPHGQGGTLGATVGSTVGLAVGGIGAFVGTATGCSVGVRVVGASVGSTVGFPIQEQAPASEISPAGQAMQVLGLIDPATPEYVPGAHGEHTPSEKA